MAVAVVFFVRFIFLEGVTKVDNYLFLVWELPKKLDKLSISKDFLGISNFRIL